MNGIGLQPVLLSWLAEMRQRICLRRTPSSIWTAVLRWTSPPTYDARHYGTEAVSLRLRLRRGSLGFEQPIVAGATCKPTEPVTSAALPSRAEQE